VVAATEARYDNGTAEAAGSTRVRDLIDLIVLARTQHVDDGALHTAIAAERAHRGLAHRDTFTVPAGWAATYPRMAATTTHCHVPPQLAQAVAFVAAFLHPAMTGDVEHHMWSATDQTWRPR